MNCNHCGAPYQGKSECGYCGTTHVATRLPEPVTISLGPGTVLGDIDAATLAAHCARELRPSAFRIHRL